MSVCLSVCPCLCLCLCLCSVNVDVDDVDGCLSGGGTTGADILRTRAILARATQRRQSLEELGAMPFWHGATPQATLPSPMSSQRAAPERRRRKRSFNDSLGDMEQSVIEQLYAFSPTKLGARLKVLEEHFIRCALRGHAWGLHGAHAGFSRGGSAVDALYSDPHVFTFLGANDEN
jgi:hypothetical protein